MGRKRVITTPEAGILSHFAQAERKTAAASVYQACGLLTRIGLPALGMRDRRGLRRIAHGAVGRRRDRIRSSAFAGAYTGAGVADLHRHLVSRRAATS